MRRTAGVLVMEHVAGGLVEGDKLVGSLRRYPEKEDSVDALLSMPADQIAECIRQQLESIAKGEKIQAIGLGFPGVIRDGIVEVSPNLQQVKGFNLQGALAGAVHVDGKEVPVRVFND